MKAVVLAGGEPPEKSTLLKELEGDSLLICADSGADCLFKYGIKPDTLLGDFDSINTEAYDYFKNSGTEIKVFPKEKDETDSQICLSEAIKKGTDQIAFLGCTGKRLDHFFGNIGLLFDCLKRGIKAEMIDDNNRIFLTDKPIELIKGRSKYFSLQSYSDVVESVSITGSKYNISDYNLQKGNPLTISNEFLEDKVFISFKSGILMIFYTKD